MPFNVWSRLIGRGVMLIMIAGAATLWLAATKQLTLYIHPRYVVFSIVACVIGLLCCIWAVNKRLHTHDEPSTKGPVTVLLVVWAALSLLILKPATLTSNIATQRGLNNQTGDTVSGISPALSTIDFFGTNDFSQLSIKDWANLLSQTNDQAYFAGRQASLSGFITPDESDKQNVFFVSRFVVTCCAVDARPVGVPVYMPGWQSTYKADQWVSVKGAFAANPSTESNQRIILRPTDTQAIAQPKDPYVH